MAVRCHAIKKSIKNALKKGVCAREYPCARIVCQPPTTRIPTPTSHADEKNRTKRALAGIEDEDAGNPRMKSFSNGSLLCIKGEDDDTMADCVLIDDQVNPDSLGGRDFCEGDEVGNTIT